MERKKEKEPFFQVNLCFVMAQHKTDTENKIEMKKMETSHTET